MDGVALYCLGVPMRLNAQFLIWWSITALVLSVAFELVRMPSLPSNTRIPVVVAGHVVAVVVGCNMAYRRLRSAKRRGFEVLQKAPGGPAAG